MENNEKMESKFKKIAKKMGEKLGTISKEKTVYNENLKKSKKKEIGKM